MDFNPKNDFKPKLKENSQPKIKQKYNNNTNPNYILSNREKNPSTKPSKSKLPSLKKTKYLVPNDMTICQFQFIIRRCLDLEEEAALYLITNKNITVTGDRTAMEIYNIYKDKEDNFLYLHYASELTWG